jgi:diguanylate cyclase (GGDEF)-like protein
MWRCLMGLLLLVGVMLGAFVAFDLRLALAWLAFGFLLVFSVIMLLLGLWALRRPNQVGPYFLAATLFGVAGASVTGLAVWGWLPLNAATWHGAEWGILIEATLLALALASQMREYQEARHQAEQLAYTDALTGLPNRRGFFGTAPEVWAAARHDALPLTVVMLDLDHFKAVNDEHGHAAGDLVLAGVAKLLRQTCRGRDLPARWGGEEFVLLLPHTDLEQARALAERLRLSIEATSFMIGTHRLALTASLGVAELHGESSLDDLIAEADECLYRAKNEGRNRVGRLAR